MADYNQEMATSGPNDVPANEPKPPQVGGYTPQRWLAEINAAKKELKNFHDQGHKITKRFLDKRESGEEEQSKVNLFTTNTQILISTLYARFPKPLVTREFEDPDDDIARVAAIMIERLLKINERDDFDCAMKNVVQDRLVPGLGEIWFRYEPTIVTEQLPAPVDVNGQPVIDAATGQPMQPSSYERLVDEEVITEYIHWNDFFWSPARTWKEVRWVAKRIKLNKQDAAARFGEQIAGMLKYSKSAMGTDRPQGEWGDASEHDIVRYAEVFEIWEKRTKQVYWVSEGCEVYLDTKPDPFKLPHFFPCPKPLLALTSTGSLIPRADYLMAQDQYRELDEINNRIIHLEKAVKVVGFVDQQNKEAQRVFKEGADAKLIPMTSFSQFMEKGGFKGAVDWLDIMPIVNAIDKLRQYRADLIAQIYEITGISDIMRGTSKATETLGAQQLKAQYASVRLQFLQMEIATFVKEALEIKADIIRELFQPQTIVVRSNIQNTPDAQFAEQAVQFMKDPLFKYRVEVHADSMAVPEFNAERDGRLGFMRAIAEMMTATGPIVQQEPAIGPVMLRLINWAASSFRSGREVEGIIDKAIKDLEAKLANPPAPPPPNPKDLAQAANQAAQADFNKAKAIGQTIENQFNIANPSNLLETPPAPPSRMQ